MNMFFKDSDPNSFSPLTLAFIGDGVYDLLVRSHFAGQSNRPVGELNRMKVSLVNCKAQAAFAKQLFPLLSEQEQSVYKRGRNAATSNTPKNSTPADYHGATGLEALFGYLYICGREDRIYELFKTILSSCL